jgi:hypothetical protein
MGMYDYVRYSAPCVACGAVISSDWQTKDGACLLETIDIDPHQIRRWYTHCPNCNTWNEKRVKMTAWEIVDASRPAAGGQAGNQGATT